MKEVISNPLTNSSEGIGNICQYHIFVIGLPTSSNHVLEGIYYHLESYQRVLDNLVIHLQEGCPIQI
jgi:hypothetical protein